MFDLMPRRAKKARRAKTTITTGPDLISTLPDPILLCILGFLKTQEAVKTCVLSKRWEHLWVSLRSLHLDPLVISCDKYNNKVKVLCDREAEDLAYSNMFVKFVTAVLLRREPLDLGMFHLYCEHLHRAHQKQARDWILYAVKHRTRVFDLLYCNFVPNCLYTCTSIEELHLSSCEVQISGPVNLPKLRKLVMCHNEVIPFPMNLLSGCLILEYLELTSYRLPDECVITNKHLKDLIFRNCDAQQLLIDAPNLLSFSFVSLPNSNCEYPPPHKAVLNVPSLMFACLDTSCFQMTEHLGPVTSMLGVLSNAELLKLYIDCDLRKEFHGGQLKKLPTFHKLKNVTVAFCAHVCFKMVAWILNSSPNLKKLTLVEQPCYFDKIRVPTSPSADVSLMAAITSFKKLEIVEVNWRGCDQIVGQLVDALIKATKELGNLKIHLSKY